VTDASGAGAGTATYGYEMAIDLSELGYNPAAASGRRVRRQRSVHRCQQSGAGDPLSVNNLGDIRA